MFYLSSKIIMRDIFISEVNIMRAGEMVKSWRHIEKVSLREAADQIGIHHLALRRIEGGKPITGDHMLKLLRWMLSE